MLQNLNCYYRTHNSVSMSPFLSHMTLSTLPSILLEVHFNTILPLVPWSHVTSPIIWWYLITRKWHFVRSSNHEWCSLCNFPQYLVISSTSGPDIFLTTRNTRSSHHSHLPNETVCYSVYYCNYKFTITRIHFMYRVSHTPVTTLTRLQASRPRNCCSIPGTARYVCLHNMQTDPGAHPACYSFGHYG